MRTRWLRRHRSRPIIVLDIPLLFEKRGWKAVDTVVVVSAPVWIQRKRVMARKGMTRAKLAHILKLQMPDHVKRARADHVIETGRLRHQTECQVRRLVACLSRKRAR
jgi:dephospho-CoA kinase